MCQSSQLWSVVTLLRGTLSFYQLYIILPARPGLTRLVQFVLVNTTFTPIKGIYGFDETNSSVSGKVNRIQ